MHIHRRHIVGEIPTMGVEHELQIATTTQLDLVTPKGYCFVKSCYATHDSEHAIVVIGKCPAVSFEEAMKDVVKLELPLMSTPG